MRYDDDRYLDEDDHDFWDDELELNSDDSGSPYSPYPDDNSGNVDNDYSPDNDYYTDNDDNAENPGNPENDYTAENDGNDENDDSDDSDDGDDSEPDYYSDAEPAPRPKKPKSPRLDPEDPDYWISNDDDSPLSGIMPSADSRWKWKATAILAVVIALFGVWIWFFRPYSDGAVKYGYIKNMERRGSLFKTFEGSMIPYKELGDPNPLYFEEVRFSVAGDSLAAHMKRMMLGCVPVRVEYETYHTSLPWNGEQKMIIVKADTADPRKIMPPEYRLNDK